MSRINYLDISELNDELQGLLDEQKAIAELREKISNLKDELAAHKDDEDAATDIEDEITNAEDDLERLLMDFGEKALTELTDLRDEIGESRKGLISDDKQLVSEYDFEEYAQELADDICSIPRKAEWPLTCIDWERAARELKMDYSNVDFRGTTYLYVAS